MDVGTGLTILGTSLGSAKLVEKLLGPTADYVGEGIKHWTEKRVNNVNRIFEIATKKLGGRIEEPGAVPPRVLKGVLDEGSYCDDFLAAEYFGGVLASSRSGVPRDDRGAHFIALLGRLSSYQIRAHYCLYHIFKRALDGTSLDIANREEQGRGDLRVPLPVYKGFMDFGPKEDGGLLISHIMAGLLRELLLAEWPSTRLGIIRELTQTVLLGEKNDGKFELSDGGVGYKTHGLAIQPTVPGVELFLWAHGRANLSYLDFFDPKEQFECDDRVTIPRGYYRPKKA